MAGWGVSVHEVPLSSSRTARISGERQNRFSLYAVPRAALAQYPDRGKLIGAIGRKEVGGSAELDLNSLVEKDGKIDLGAGGQNVDLVVRYRLEPSPSGDGVVFTRVNGQAATEDPGGSRPADSGGPGEARVRWIVAGVAAALAASVFGFWLAGRLRRRPPESRHA